MVPVGEAGDKDRDPQALAGHIRNALVEIVHDDRVARDGRSIGRRGGEGDERRPIPRLSGHRRRNGRHVSRDHRSGLRAARVASAVRRSDRDYVVVTIGQPGKRERGCSTCCNLPTALRISEVNRHRGIARDRRSIP